MYGKVKLLHLTHNVAGFDKFMKRLETDFSTYFTGEIKTNRCLSASSFKPSFDEMKKYDVIIVGNSGWGIGKPERFGNSLARLLEETDTAIITMLFQNDQENISTCGMEGKWKSGKYCAIMTDLHRFGRYGEHKTGGISGVKSNGMKYIIPGFQVKNGFPKMKPDMNCDTMVGSLNKKRRSRIIAEWDIVDFEPFEKGGERFDKVIGIAELCDLKHLHLNFCQNKMYSTYKDAPELIFKCVRYIHRRKKCVFDKDDEDEEERVEYVFSNVTTGLVSHDFLKIEVSNQEVFVPKIFFL